MTSKPKRGAGPSLFAAAGLDHDAPRPLADKLRPAKLAEVVGQDHLLGPDGVLTRMLATRSLGSLVFWGPPGTGKTTVARLLAAETSLHFEQISAIFTGVADLKRVFEEARVRRETGQGTLLFVDEIHRFNRAQQDSFLPVMEDGTIVLVGATTENPSFELNAPLLSRARVLVFKSLDAEAVEKLLARAEAMEGKPLPLDPVARAMLVGMADGDGRASLTLTEEVWRAARPGETFDAAALQDIVQRRAPIYDKSQDGHYNLISALHKSVRGSDPDAALYYLCRMIDAGEPPLYIARRVVRMAIEDIGLADPQALVVANAAKEAYDFLGSPEGELAIAEAVIYLATAPKSNAAYTAYGAAMRTAKERGSLLPPKHILNAPTKLMKTEGYGRGYAYDHDAEEAFSGQDYFPETLGRQQFYDPPERGFERDIRKRLEYWAKVRKAKAAGNPDNYRVSKLKGQRSEIALSLRRCGAYQSAENTGLGSMLQRVLLAACAISVVTISSALAVEQFVGRWAVTAEVCASHGGDSAANSALVATDTALWWFDGYCRIGKMYKAQAVYVQAHCGKGDVPVMLDAKGDRMKVSWANKKTEELKRCTSLAPVSTNPGMR